MTDVKKDNILHKPMFWTVVTLGSTLVAAFTFRHKIGEFITKLFRR